MTQPGGLGRVTFNPLKHVDLFGTLIFARRSPANARTVLIWLRQTRSDQFSCVAQPASRHGVGRGSGAGHQSSALALAAGFMAFTSSTFCPPVPIIGICKIFQNAIDINVVLALFNMIPLATARWRWSRCRRPIAERLRLAPRAA